MQFLKVMATLFGHRLHFVTISCVKGGAGRHYFLGSSVPRSEKHKWREEIEDENVLPKKALVQIKKLLTSGRCYVRSFSVSILNESVMDVSINES